jgi:hypothetical protein
LRGQAPAGGMPQLSGSKLTTTVPTAQESLLGLIREATGSGLVAPPSAPVVATPANPPTLTVHTESAAEVITLTRVSYKLTPPAAEALSTFLKDNVKDSILVETVSQGDALIVTTTPDAQQAIGQFIHLLQGPTALPTPKKSRVSDSPKGDYSGPDGPK